MPSPAIEDRLGRIEQLLERRSLLQRVLRFLEVAIIPILLGYLAYVVNDASNRIAEAQLDQADRFVEVQLAQSEKAWEKQIELEYTKIYFEHIFSANEAMTRRALDLLIPLANTSPGGARVATSLVNIVLNDTTQPAEIREQAIRIAEEIQTWGTTKQIAISEIYNDRLLTFYCSCPFEPVGRSSGAIDVSACDIGSPDQPRASRMEWEQIVPASFYGRELACWTEGLPECDSAGRMCCERHDPNAQAMMFDLHNMVPAVGVINRARGNHPYAEIPGEARSFGTCDFEVDGNSGLVEPPPHVRGDIARIWLYMRETYGIPDPNPEYELMLMKWHQSDPVDEWERERNRRIADIQGRQNHWVAE